MDLCAAFKILTQAAFGNVWSKIFWPTHIDAGVRAKLTILHRRGEQDWNHITYAAVRGLQHQQSTRTGLFEEHCTRTGIQYTHRRTHILQIHTIHRQIFSSSISWRAHAISLVCISICVLSHDFGVLCNQRYTNSGSVIHKWGSVKNWNALPLRAPSH